MFDTNIVIVGNVLTAPEWRRTTNTNSLVANFKVASTARRLDRESGRWVDGNSLRVRVTCWRKLAEGVASSVMVGDPILVVGRLYTRDWTDAEGNQRTTYEMEAVAVGHDLARGRGKFLRNRPALATSAVEDAEADGQARGEATEEVPEGEAPARYGDGLFDDDPEFEDVPAVAPGGYDPIAAVRGGGLPATGRPVGAGPADGDEELAPYGAGQVGATGPDTPAGADVAAEVSGDTGAAADALEPVLDEAVDLSLDGPDGSDPGLPRRPRRSRGRTPVPA